MKFKNVDEKIKKYWMIKRTIILMLFLLLLMVIIFVNINSQRIKLSCIVLLSLMVVFQTAYAFLFPFKEYCNYCHLVKEHEIIIMKGWIRKISTVIPVDKITYVKVYRKGLINMINLTNIIINIGDKKFRIEGLNLEDANKIQFILGFNEKGEKI